MVCKPGSIGALALVIAAAGALAQKRATPGAAEPVRNAPAPAAASDAASAGATNPAAVNAGAASLDETHRLLERLEAEERVRRDARAHSEAAAEADLARRQGELSEAQRRKEAAAADAERDHARRRAAMREWHASFNAALGPLLAARVRLYRRIPHRMFARVRLECEDVARAVEESAARYRPAPEPHVEALARDLLAVYRDSARLCAGGAYFSFRVEESKVRLLVGELIEALEPYGLVFPWPAAESSPVNAGSTKPAAPPD